MATVIYSHNNIKKFEVDKIRERKKHSQIPIQIIDEEIWFACFIVDHWQRPNVHSQVTRFHTSTAQ